MRLEIESALDGVAPPRPWRHTPLDLPVHGLLQALGRKGGLKIVDKDGTDLTGQTVLEQHPLVLALNGANGFDRSFEMINALYGSAQVTFNLANPGEARETRAMNGYWGHPGGWKHRQVAGLLAGSISGSESVATNAPTFRLHPDPMATVLPLEVWDQAVLANDRIETSPPTRPLNAFFGLPEGWLLGDPFPRS